MLLFYPLSAGLSTLRPNLIEAGFDAGDLIVIGRQRGELRAERLGDDRARIAELLQAVHHTGNVDPAGFARKSARGIRQLEAVDPVRRVVHVDADDAALVGDVVENIPVICASVPVVRVEQQADVLAAVLCEAEHLLRRVDKGVFLVLRPV